MKNNKIIEKGVIAGNLYPKYSTRNPLFRVLVNRFLGNVDELVARVNPPDIHEVGCGEGYLISRYAKRNRKLVASDFSEQIIALADGIARKNELDIDFRVRSIYSVIPEKDSATLVICSEVLEHLDEPTLALEALTRIAKPYLLVSVPREPIWRMLNIARFKYVLDWGNTPGHLQHWSKVEFLEFLNKSFEILQVRTPLPWILVLARVKR